MDEAAAANASPAAAVTRLTMAVALAVCSLALATVVLRALWLDFYERLGVELPRATALVFQTGDALRAGWGLLVLLAALALVLGPVRVVPRSAALRPWLRLSLAQCALLGLAMWGAIELPLLTLQRCLCDKSLLELADGPRSTAVALVLMTAPLASLVVGLGQAGAWIRLAIDAVPLARGTLPLEAGRAVQIAGLPALALGTLTYALLDEWRLRPPAFLLVSPAVAVTGTVVVATFGAALSMRLRHASPHLGRPQE
jgi:hypothetical protein